MHFKAAANCVFILRYKQQQLHLLWILRWLWASFGGKEAPDGSQKFSLSLTLFPFGGSNKTKGQPTQLKAKTVWDSNQLCKSNQMQTSWFPSSGSNKDRLRWLKKLFSTSRSITNENFRFRCKEKQTSLSPSSKSRPPIARFACHPSGASYGPGIWPSHKLVAQNVSV